MFKSNFRFLACLFLIAFVSLHAEDKLDQASAVDRFFLDRDEMMPKTFPNRDFRILPDRMSPDNYPEPDRGFWKRPDQMSPYDGESKRDRCKALIQGRMYQDILELVQKDKDQILTKQLEITALKLAFKAAKKKESSIEKYLAFHEKELRHHPISLELLEKYKKHFLPTDARIVNVDMLYFENLYPSEKSVDNEKLSAYVLASIMKNNSGWDDNLFQINGAEKNLLIDRISLFDFSHSTNLDFRDAAILRILGFSQEVAGNYNEPSVSKKVSEILQKISGFTDEEKTLSLSEKISELTESLKSDFSSVKEKFIDEYLDCVGGSDRESACRDLDSLLLPNFEKAMQDIIKQLGTQEAFSDTYQGKITLGSHNGALDASIDLNKPLEIDKKTPPVKPRPLSPPPAPPKVEDFRNYRCNGVPPSYRTDVMAAEEEFSFTDFMKNCGWGSLKGLMKELFLTDSGPESKKKVNFDSSSKLNTMPISQKADKEDLKNFEDLIKEDQYEEVEPYVDEVTTELYELYKSKLKSASASEIHSIKMSLGINQLSGFDESKVDAIAKRSDFLITASNLSLNPLELLDAIKRKSKEFLSAAKNVFDQMKIIYPGFFTLSCWDGEKIGLEFCELIGATLGSTLRNLAIAIPIGLIAAPATAGGSLAVAIQSAAMKAMMEQAAGKLGDIAVNFTSHAVSRMVSYGLAKGEGETKRLNMEKISAVIEKSEFFNKIFGIANPNEIKKWLQRPGQIVEVQKKLQRVMEAINFIGSTALRGVELDQAIEDFKKTMPELDWDEIKSWTILDKS